MLKNSIKYPPFMISILCLKLKGNRNGSICSKHARKIFMSTCMVLAGYMALTQVFRYLDNDDVSSIGYKIFNESPEDRYPTFSICLYDEQLLYHSRFNEIKLEKFLYAFALQTEDSKHTNSNNSYEEEIENWPFYNSYTDPDTVCFTRKSEMEHGVIRQKDWLSFDYNYLAESKTWFRIYFHHPKQLVRTLHRPNFEVFPDEDLSYYNRKITFKLNQVTVLRKRPDANVRCDANLKDDDNLFIMEVIRRVGCIPIYWESIVPIDNTSTLCTTEAALANVSQAIKNKKDIMKWYEPPCDHMRVFLDKFHYATFKYAVDYVLMELVYMDEAYQEFVNSKDFTFETFWSSVGGFVGIFLGYSLLQFPELLDQLWLWCPMRKMVQKKGRFRNKGVQNGKGSKSHDF